MLYKTHNTTQIHRYRFPTVKLINGKPRLALGHMVAPWLNGVPILMFYNVLTISGVKRISTLF